MSRLSAFKKNVAAALACTAFALATCTGDATDALRLPDGKYPMTFAVAVERLTQTRATTDNT